MLKPVAPNNKQHVIGPIFSEPKLCWEFKTAGNQTEYVKKIIT